MPNFKVGEMVWTSTVGDPVDAEGEPFDGDGHQDFVDVTAPALEAKTPPAEIAEQGRVDIDSTLRELQTSLAALTSEVTAFHERSAAKELTITRMQQRLEELQGDQVRALLRPVFEQLAALHGDITSIAERVLRTSDDTRMGKELAFLTQRVETAFEALGLVSVEADVGVEFDSRLHAAIRSKPTQDAALDKSIAEVQRQGFTTPGTAKTELHARVVVYTFDPQAPGGQETVTAAQVEAGIAVEAAPALSEGPGPASGPEVTRPPEPAPRVPLPPMPAGYTEGS